MQYAAALLALAVAVKASPVPFPQGVTDNISPSAPPPPGCTPNYSGIFGIAIASITGSSPSATAPAKRAAQTGGHDEQWANMPMATAIQQIGDGQIQAHTLTTTVAAAAQTSVGQSSGGRPQQASAAATPVSAQANSQPAATASSSSAPAASSDSAPATVACNSNSTLSLSLSNGVLTDGKGRTGYIASNFQFQFDSPAQSGALYTSGFSVCANGSLSLGGSAVWYQCLSGDFYNLYDRNWAPQCEPIIITAIELVDCGGQ